jgi:hypothetical protein
MTLLIETETEVKTRAFLAEESTPEEFEQWIISAIDDVASVDERNALWEIRLLLTEYGERLRPIDDARNRAAEFLRDLSAPLWADSGSNNTSLTV